MKGYSQIEGVDYDEIFPPVVHYETVRITFRLATLEGMYMTGFDAKATFLYGKLDEEIYMKQPEGFTLKGQEHLVLKLRKALYSLKQAALAWWKELESFMKTQGFKHAYANVGIFIYKDSKGRYVITLVYGLFMGTDRTLVDRKKAACSSIGNAVTLAKSQNS